MDYGAIGSKAGGYDLVHVESRGDLTDGVPIFGSPDVPSDQSYHAL